MIEAVEALEIGVKFTAHHTETSVCMPPEWEELNEARTYLHRQGLIGVYPNGVGYGNISLRVGSGNDDENCGAGNGGNSPNSPNSPNSCEFLITGTNTGYPSILSITDYCLVKDFDISDNAIVTEGFVQASSETMTHGAVYRNHPGVRCVVHIHSRGIFDKMLKGDYKATPAEAAYGTPELALAVGRCVAEAKRQSKAQSAQPVRLEAQSEGAIVLAGHEEGVIVYASGVKRALEIVSLLAENVERENVESRVG